MRIFASPGIDSPTDEVGIYNSGAGQTPEAPAAKEDSTQVPSEWRSNNPLWDRQVGHLVKGYSATQGIPASSIRVRKRGISPFGGTGKRFMNIMGRPGYYQEKAGGIADMNLGADSHIAGGKSAAATMVRLNGPKKANEGQKLAVLPKQATRNGVLPMPSGGFMQGMAAPVMPQVPGLASIVKILANPSSVKGGS